MAIIIANAFSLGMIPGWTMEEGFDGAGIWVRPVTEEDVRDQWAADNADRVWAVGHKDTSVVVGQMLTGQPIPENRVNVELGPDDVLYVAQLQGGRLPEGATTLPDGFSFRWLQVTLSSLAVVFNEEIVFNQDFVDRRYIGKAKL